MNQREDLYEILQVHPAAHQDVIQAAYRRLTLLYHPDKNPSPEAAEMMKRLNLAYEVLSDPAKRADYDRTRAAGPRSSGDTSSGPYTQTDYPGPGPTYRDPYNQHPRPGRSAPRPSRSKLPALAFWVIVAAAIPVVMLVTSKLSSSPLPAESLQADIPTAAPTPTLTPRPTPTAAPTPTFMPRPTPTPYPSPTFTPLPTSTPLPSGVPIKYERFDFSYNRWEEVHSSTECYQTPCFRSGDTRSVMQTIFFDRSDTRYRADQPQGEVISFYLRVPSGHLELKMEGSSVATWTATPGWLWVACELRPGTNYYIEWDYRGEGRAWLDDIQLLPGTKQANPSCWHQQVGR